MKEQLVDLLYQEIFPLSFERHRIEYFADRLIESGVVKLPCKIGDVVYQVSTDRNIYQSTIKSIIYDTSSIAFDERAIGKTVFLSREEAEAALGR